MKIALTPGEPAGIGADIILQLAAQGLSVPVVAFADKTMLAERAAQLGLRVQLIDYREQDELNTQPNQLLVKSIPLAKPCIPGQLDTANAPYVLEALGQATHGCVHGEFDALVTGPIHKGVINQAGITCSGHTDFLAMATQTPTVVMMLVAKQLRVALATMHLPLKQVAEILTREYLETRLRVLEQALKQQWAIAQPTIAVCGLNPHAGEGGYLGTEEIDIITPVIRRLQHEGMKLIGPLPADTAFVPNILASCDVVMAMYHDQGLPVLKYAGFGEAVNITLGLPFIRTSVDHGTALELAASGRASASSLAAAINMATHMSGQIYGNTQAA